MINDVYTDRRLEHIPSQNDMCWPLRSVRTDTCVRISTHSHTLLSDLLEKAMTFLWSLFIYLSAPHILSLCDDCISSFLFLSSAFEATIKYVVRSYKRCCLFSIISSLCLFDAWISIQVATAMAIISLINCT